MKFDYDFYFPRAIPGQREGSILFHRVTTYRNARGVKQVVTLAIPAAPDSGAEYAVTLDYRYPARFTTDADATQTELQAGLLQAIRTNPAFGAKVVADTPDGASITLTANSVLDVFTVVPSGTGLTATETTAASIPTGVPIGRFVGQAAGETDLGCAYLPTNVTDRIVGITSMIKDIERVDFRRDPHGTTEYAPNEAMDIVDSTGQSGGIWVEAVEDDILPTDSVYVSVGTNDWGKATKNNTGTIDISAKARFREKPKRTRYGTVIALVEFNIV